MPDESRFLTTGLRATTRRPAFCLTVLAVAGLTAACTASAPAQQTAVTRTDIIRAEDARGRGPEGITPILAGLRDPALRETSIRAIGRLERPDLIAHVVKYLDDPAMQAPAAEALAQSMRWPSGQADRGIVDFVYNVLRVASSESDGFARGVMARSLGRLPYGEPRQARAADSVLVGLAPVHAERLDLPAMEGIAHGLYSLARARRTAGNLSPSAVEWLRHASGAAPGRPEAVTVRRLAWLALTANGTVSRRDVLAGLADPDAQVRRLAVAALPNVPDSAVQREQLARVAHDRDPMVRLEWVRVYRQLVAATDCGPVLAAMSDTVHHVRLAAIDALGGPCPQRDSIVPALRRAIDTGPSGASGRTGGGVSWHARAHALTSLARIDGEAARDLLRRDSRHPVWQVRMYVARGAAAIRDSALLTSLAFDQVGSVREVALQGLSATIGHLGDLVYVRALSSRDYHVVLAAARALRGAPVRDSVLPGILDALERITREQRQTSRDPRLEMLARVREMGRPTEAARLRPLLADVDEVIASAAAGIMNELAGVQQYAPAARPARRDLVPATGPLRMRVTMSAATGGGAFDLVLDGARAPMTTARVVDLVRSRYYDGLTFHRVVPNFVLQGGSPGMNEYVGDGPFMRDELSLAHHARGTVGISTRGRDTGDAQWFINLVDNYRLDHDYTVFATVVAGMDVVDRILEGDVMESVRIVPN
jgi:cyclophilin family peptidyl-prolyl cis-trans isomerase/HEAT repeat protein